MQNETIDKLKNAGYITVTDDSQGIANAVGIPSGDSFPYNYTCPDDFTITIQPSDWQYSEEDEMWLAHFDINIPINQVDVIHYWECNGQSSDMYDNTCNIPANSIPGYEDFSEDPLMVGLNVDQEDGTFTNIIAVDVGATNVKEGATAPTITLNFEYLIFIGLKK